MTGVPLLITFVIAIVVMILAISKLKLHPFLAIMGVALLLAIIVGIPLAIANLKMIPITCFPFGKAVIDDPTASIL